MKHFLLPEPIRDMLVAYLIERPFKEVEQGVAILRALKEAPEEAPPAPPAPPDTAEKKG